MDRDATRDAPGDAPGDAPAPTPPKAAAPSGAPASLRRPHRLRRRIYEVLEIGRGDDRVSQIVDLALITLIVLNVLAFALETVPDVKAAYGGWLFAFEVVSVVIFTTEYALRLWSCVEMPFFRRVPGWRARLRFAQRPYLVIDLLAILPFYLQFLVPMDLRLLRMLRLFRLLKLARYSPALHALAQVVVNERRALGGSLLLMTIVLAFAACGVYFLEREAQPEKFGTIPDAAWWAMATLTTVGYGDVAPVTPGGKMFGAVVMLGGLGMFALPIAILSSGFAQEVSRRDFVVTWPLMARIPLLAELEAPAVAELLPHLRAHNYPPRWDVIRPGDDGEAMYFIAAGRIVARSPSGDQTLETGDFFGEIAMLYGHRHQVRFSTETRVRVLELDRDDFRRFEAVDPETAHRIRRIAEARRRARDDGRAEPRNLSEIPDEFEP